MRVSTKPVGRKVRLLALMVVAAATLGLATSAVMASSNVPAPYAGLKNPFPWNDTGVQAEGKRVYVKSCVGCHGVGGANIKRANFAAPGFPSSLEADADYYFWALSEGRPSDGMPSYKSTLAEEERWQVLTYLWALNQAAPSVANGPATAILSGGPMFPSPTIALAVDSGNSARSGLTLMASLRDASGKPVNGVPVTFFLKKDFFTADWMQIGQATSNKEGKAAFLYPPSEDGPIQFSVHWGNLEAKSDFTVTTRSRSYRAEAGIRLPSIGPEVAVGLDVAPAQMGEASPTGGIRLPGGTLSWLLLFDAAILLVWTTYFRVFRLVMHIPEAHGREGSSVRLVPFVATGFVLVVGAVLALAILHGPYTHLHLGP